MPRPDPHSYFDTAQPRTRHLRLRWSVDFEAQRVRGTATLVFEAPGVGALDLDTRGLTLHGATTQDGTPVPFVLHPEEPILGSRLALDLPPGTRELTLDYETAPDASALQWLAPEQTAGNRAPFLFSQCQAIHARALLPCQDCPAARVSYSAEVEIPEGLAAVMSAGPLGTVPGSRPGTVAYRFEMPQAIPPYLLALAVGRLESRDLSPRSRVWAEPETVAAAAWEFEAVEEMIRKTESLFGPYDWDRFDLLVLPPSFPYGGMENPRITFLTPTLLAGDRSLVDVVVHELAHSWTGNLVTNANAEHFWLNEGFTVWAERRILEVMHGQEAAVQGWALGQRSLEESLERFADQPELSRLRTHLDGVDPDDAFSTIPYEKGARLVLALERAVGRASFDAFLRGYMDKFRFQALTTEEFCAFVEECFPGLLERVHADAWLHQPGLPADAPSFRSATLEGLMALGKGSVRPAREQMEAWKPSELVIYLQNLPRELPLEDCAWLDGELKLTDRGNYEVLVEWLCIAASSGYEPAFPRIREVLSKVGRMKYLRPLYTALGRSPRTRDLARSIFADVKARYHQLSRRVVEGVMDKYPA